MSNILVSNTGPLIALSLINRLDLLPTLFDRIVVPEAVHEEILHGAGLHEGLRFYHDAQWIEVQGVERAVDPLLTTVLHFGEASVIQLAREIHADCVLIDEKKARKVARVIYGLNVIGSVRVIIDAKKLGLIESVGSELDKMKVNGYWIHHDIINQAKRVAGET
jgi:predicted nucleic acid-binding protein